jgi:two-component system, NarL family, invasion response regulator UvrY
MISVLIIEDHLLVRNGLRQVLDQEYRGVTVTEARTAAEGAALLAKRKWSLITLDLTLPDGNGFALLASARATCAGCPILVVSMHADDLYADRARQAGAAGYVCKTAGRSELVKAIAAVLAGGEYFKTPASSSAIRRGRHESLSEQEYKVLLATAAGKRPIEIARELDLSIKTVSTYKKRLLVKMGLKSTTDIVRYVLENGLS